MDRGPRPRDQKGFLHLLGAGAGVRAEQHNQHATLNNFKDNI